MRYSAAEKLEIISLVEQSHLPQRRSLASLGIPRQTFYRWYDRFRTGGPEALADRPSRPDRVAARHNLHHRSPTTQRSARTSALSHNIIDHICLRVTSKAQMA